MSITARQYQDLQAEACRMAAELGAAHLLDGLIAVYEAGRLLHMTKSTLIGLLGSVVLRCIDDQADDAAPPAPPRPSLWPRVVCAVHYDEGGNLTMAGIDGRDRPWSESCAAAGGGQEAWLLNQLYVERRFGRRSRKFNQRKRMPR